MATALVTGGTAGIGRAFATELAERGYDLVLVARDQNKLDETGQDLRERFNRTVELLPADLSKRADLDPIIERLSDSAHPIDILVNNAGFGLNASLLDENVELQERAMDVMCRTVLILSAAAGRSMKYRKKGAIINISSVSSWIVKGNYSAIKRWVLTYTEALALELADTGVQATVVCPGWVKTELHQRAGVKRPNLPSWAWVEASEVARCALDGAEQGKQLVIPTRKWSLAVWFLEHCPKSVSRAISAKIIRSRKTDG